jgi:hypothetical protein
MDLDIAEKNYRSSTSIPPAGTHRSIGSRTKGVGLTTSSPMDLDASARNGTPAKGRWGGPDDRDLNEIG